MEKMARAFNTTVSKLEDELSNLILEGQIQARIDSHNKVNGKIDSVGETERKFFFYFFLRLKCFRRIIYACMCFNTERLFSSKRSK